MQKICRGPGYFTGTNFSVGKHEAAVRDGCLSGTTMSGERLDGSDRVGFSPRKTKPLTEEEKKARERAEKLEDARELLAEVEAEVRDKEEAEAEAVKKAKARADAIAEARRLVAEADAPK